MANKRESHLHAAPREFFDGYVKCALWSSSDESAPSGGYPLDKNYGPQDVSSKTKQKMWADCDRFVAENRHYLLALDMGAAGHDFWLSRNGHGAGFFDRDLGEAGDKLQEAARKFGSFDLYVSRGKVHGS